MLALLALLAQDVEGQPLAANAARVVQAFELLGSPLGVDLAAAGEDPRKIKGGARSLDLLPRDARRPARGVAAPSPPGRLDAAARQGPQSEGLREPLAVASPRSGPVYAGAAPLSLKRQGQEVLRENENLRGDERFLQLELFGSPPMAPRLSGLAAERYLRVAAEAP